MLLVPMENNHSLMHSYMNSVLPNTSRFIHVRRNVKDKLNECGIPHDLSNRILNDIFGQRLDTVFQEGLVESVDNDYERK